MPLTHEQEYKIAFGVWILAQIKHEGMDKKEILNEIEIRLRQQRQIKWEIEELQSKYEQLNSSGTVEERNKSD